MQGIRLNKKSISTRYKAFKALAAMVLFSLVAIIYIAQHLTILRIGFNIAEKESKYQQLIDEKDRLESKVAVLESVNNIRDLIKEKELPLRPQNRSQVFVIAGGSQ